jgi:ParB family transcriptional regulator, chromosome partitioning protein
MAKRKRLTPADPVAQITLTAPETKGALRPGLTLPPIAQVAGDASTTAALAEVAGVLAAARAEGRLVQRLALLSIDTGYLVRDRIDADTDDMQALMDSLRSHGQRTPIEVTETEPGRYGLISGWRRVTALARLQQETGDARYGAVLALQRRPESAGDAYVAMVEENEVRAGLSYYERARIVAKAVEHGVFGSDKAALQALFATASRSKRSKIGSFLGIYRQLGPALRFPAALPERLGLALAHAITQTPDAVSRILLSLQDHPAKSAADEGLQLTKIVKKLSLNARIEPVLQPSAVPERDQPQSAADPVELRPGVFLKAEGMGAKRRLILSGPNTGPVFRERLEAWLKDFPG